MNVILDWNPKDFFYAPNTHKIYTFSQHSFSFHCLSVLILNPDQCTIFILHFLPQFNLLFVIKLSTSNPYDDGGGDTGPGYDYSPAGQQNHQEEHVHIEEHHQEQPHGEWKKKLTWKEDWQKVWKTEKKEFWETKWKQVSVPVWKEFKFPVWKEERTPEWKVIKKPVWKEREVPAWKEVSFQCTHHGSHETLTNEL